MEEHFLPPHISRGAKSFGIVILLSWITSCRKENCRSARRDHPVWNGLNASLKKSTAIRGLLFQSSIVLQVEWTKVFLQDFPVDNTENTLLAEAMRPVVVIDYLYKEISIFTSCYVNFYYFYKHFWEYFTNNVWL